MLSTVMFDLDGTLIDPQVGITASICFALEQMGIVPPDPASLNWAIGPPLQESIPAILGTNDLVACDRCLKLYRERFSTIGLYEHEVYPGIADCLIGLREAEIELFVATSKPQVFAIEIIERLGFAPLFSAVYGCELDGTRSNKSELLGHLLLSEGIDAKATAMVGDRKHDVVGGRANGMKTVGVLYGYGSQDELKQAGADYLCDHPQDISKLLLRLASSHD